MGLSFATSIEEIKVDGVTKYSPAYLIDGTPHIVSQQGKGVYYDTHEEANEYFEEEGEEGITT